MFWKNLCALCNAHNTTPNTVCKALGLSSATSTHWKQGAIPRDTTLQKIAEHFGVTVDDLLRDPAQRGKAMFKQNFIAYCNKKGESPSYVCRQVGIAPATFSCWTDESVPRKATLFRIADYFGITPEDLLRDPAEQTAPEETTSAPTDHPMLDARFYELLDQLTLKEIRDLKAQMEETIKNRR